MKNNKGFTFVEMLAVVTIIAVITGISAMSYTNYQKEAKEKEKIALRNTLVSSLQNYMLDKDNTFNGTSITLLELQNANRINSLSFNKKQFTSNDLNTSNIKVVQLGNTVNLYGTDEAKMIEDGVCATKSTYDDPDTGETVDPSTIRISCERDSNTNAIIGSNNEGYCLFVINNGEIIINDRTSGKLYCRQ